MKQFAGVLLSVCLMLTACSFRVPRAVDNTIFAMDTVMSFAVYGTQEDMDAVTGTIFALEDKLSVTKSDSLVARLNLSGSVEADEDLRALVDAAKRIGEATGEALKVTVYPIVKAWGFTTGTYQVPDNATLAALLPKTHAAPQIDETSIRLSEGAEVDFGSLAKGYAGEKCAALLRERGVTSAILRLSGNIQTVGHKPDGSLWRVGIQDPRGGTEDLLGMLEVENQAVVTSGGYQRYFEQDGVVYHHIIDPATGAPAQSGLTSVTVVCPSGTWADGLSTALFVLGRENALALYQTLEVPFEAVLVEESGAVWLTPGLTGSFQLMNQNYRLYVSEG